MSQAERAAKRKAMLTVVTPPRDGAGSIDERLAALKAAREAELRAAIERAPLTPYKGGVMRAGPTPEWLEVPILFDGDGDGDFGRQWRWLNLAFVAAHDSWTWDVDGAELTRVHLATGKSVVLDVLYRDFCRALRWRRSLIGRMWLALRRLAWRSPQRLSPPRP